MSQKNSRWYGVIPDALFNIKAEVAPLASLRTLLFIAGVGYTFRIIAFFYMVFHYQGLPQHEERIVNFPTQDLIANGFKCVLMTSLNEDQQLPHATFRPVLRVGGSSPPEPIEVTKEYQDVYYPHWQSCMANTKGSLNLTSSSCGWSSRLSSTQQFVCKIVAVDAEYANQFTPFETGTAEAELYGDPASLRKESSIEAHGLIRITATHYMTRTQMQQVVDFFKSDAGLEELCRPFHTGSGKWRTWLCSRETTKMTVEESVGLAFSNTEFIDAIFVLLSVQLLLLNGKNPSENAEAGADATVLATAKKVCL
jgi:hypothetical protein